MTSKALDTDPSLKSQNDGAKKLHHLNMLADSAKH